MCAEVLAFCRVCKLRGNKVVHWFNLLSPLNWCFVRSCSIERMAGGSAVRLPSLKLEAVETHNRPAKRLTPMKLLQISRK